MSCKISNSPTAVICNKSVIPIKGVVHYNSSYISEAIVMKHTSAKYKK